jgi:hypothetical protein
MNAARHFDLTRDPTQAFIIQARTFSRRSPTDKTVLERVPRFRNQK